MNVENMFETIMSKLGKLDIIDGRMISMEQELKQVKESLEYACAEVETLKKENAELKKSDSETKERLAKVEEQNSTLNSRVIDLQARSMRDNLMFYNLPEREDENTNNLIHNLLQEQLGISNAKTIKIDRSHRIGRRTPGSRRPRAIVAKFNFYPDKERILANARRLKGTGIAIYEQFPEEIVKLRKRLLPEMKKARED
ncbi:Hypothetical predicted protein, partial [Paramuricea clavata]